MQDDIAAFTRLGVRAAIGFREGQICGKMLAWRFAKNDHGTYENRFKPRLNLTEIMGLHTVVAQFF